MLEEIHTPTKNNTKNPATLNPSNAIEVNNLCKKYLIYKKPSDRLKQMFARDSKQYFTEFDALRDVSFNVKKGEILGIVGRNGSGKSTLLQMICGTLSPTSGNVKIQGRISALLELGAGFNVDFTGKENVYLNASILGLSKDEIDDKYPSIIQFASIGEHINQPVKNYSSGMYVRLAFAVAIATTPDILIVDEALAVGDEIFQRKCFARFEELQSCGTTILFVSHSANIVTQICHRALLIDDGQYILDGNPKEVISYYHKLIYAPAEKQQQIRTELITSANKLSNQLANQKPIIKDTQPNDTNKKNSDINNDIEESYNPNMIPESTIINEEKNVTIFDYYITTESGKKVNMLRRNKKYKCHLSVKFGVETSNMRINIRIRNKSGIVISGANTTIYDDEFSHILSGQQINMNFNFNCPFLSETYFIELGCSSTTNGSRTPLARITDALMFRVIPEAEIGIGGMIDIGLSPNINFLECNSPYKTKHKSLK